VKELLTAAKAEVANSEGILLDNGAENGNGGDAEAAGGAPGVDASIILELIEAQINANGDAASDASNSKSAQPGQQAGAGTPQNPIIRIPRRGRR
jgi:hypothetical protein